MSEIMTFILLRMRKIWVFLCFTKLYWKMNDFLNMMFERFERQITDSIFCFVQNDKELMKAYLNLVAKNGNLQYVNSHIAQEIAKRYGLECNQNQVENPDSNLIQSYSELRKTN